MVFNPLLTYQLKKWKNPKPPLNEIIEAHPTPEINLLSYVVHECMVGDCDKCLFSEKFKKIYGDRAQEISLLVVEKHAL